MQSNLKTYRADIVYSPAYCIGCGHCTIPSKGICTQIYGHWYRTFRAYNIQAAWQLLYLEFTPSVIQKCADFGSPIVEIHLVQI